MWAKLECTAIVATETVATVAQQQRHSNYKPTKLKYHVYYMYVVSVKNNDALSLIICCEKLLLYFTFFNFL